MTKFLGWALLGAFAIGLVVSQVVPDSRQQAVPAQTQAAAPTSPGSQQVTHDNFPGRWPVVARRATLRCESSDIPVLTVEIGSTRYALNGTARTMGYADLGAMWLDNDANPGAKVSISDFSDAARRLCAPQK